MKHSVKIFGISLIILFPVAIWAIGNYDLTHASGIVVIDNRTGLMWEKCLQNTSGANCNLGTAPGVATWSDAVAYCQGLNTATFAGHGAGWRLPNINELFSIVNHEFDSPSINSTAFPTTPPFGLEPQVWNGTSNVDYSDEFDVDRFFWSSTTHPYVEENALVVNFLRGTTTHRPKNTPPNQHFFRCVRSI